MTIPDQIVLATDFSPASDAALSTARGLARIFNAKVTLLHIFQYLPQHLYQVPVEWMIEIIRKDIEGKLLETERVLKEAGLQVEVVIVEGGIPPQQILDFVEEGGAPLLIMGTHARAGVERFFLGSTTEQVLRQANCPVITVGPQVAARAGQESCFRKLLYATDFSPASLAAAPLIRVFFGSAATTLQILHVSADQEVTSNDERFELVRRALRNDLAGSSQDRETFLVLHGTNVSQAIVNEAERDATDLVILGVRRASAFASHLAPKVAFQIIAAAPCAVLTISS